MKTTCVSPDTCMWRGSDTFTCPSCNRVCCPCLGAADREPDLCDDCATERKPMTQNDINLEATALAYALFSLRKLSHHWVARNNRQLAEQLVFYGYRGEWEMTVLGRKFFHPHGAIDMAAYMPVRMPEAQEQDIARRHSAIARQYLIDMGAAP